MLRFRRRLPAVFAATLLLMAFTVLLPSGFLSQAQAQGPNQSGRLSASALSQIAALQEEKGGRTRAQQKMDSQLVYAAKRRRTQVIARGVTRLQVAVPVTADGRVLVDITATVSAALLRQIASVGGTVVNSHARYRAIRAWLPVIQIEALAARGDVNFIKRADLPVTSGGLNSANLDSTGVSSREVRRAGNVANLTAWLQARPTGTSIGTVDDTLGGPLAGTFVSPLAGTFVGTLESLWAAPRFARNDKARDEKFSTNGDAVGPVTNAGSVTSQGDVTHAAASARATYGVDGTGIKIGVLSDSVDHLAAAQSSGNLPADVTVLAGQAGPTSSGEGTAMMEIVYDLAPGAKLFFATGFTGAAQMATNIRNLRFSSGCDIIIDDISYGGDDSPFQDGVIAQAVSDVSADGALYFSSAANSGNKNDGTSGTYQGDFADGGASSSLAKAGRLHDFGGGTTFDTITVASSRHSILYWSDPRGASANDYDFYLMDSGGNVIASSTTTQNGFQDPIEFVSRTDGGGNPTGVLVGDRLVVVKASGAARFLHIDTQRGRLNISTQGSTRGHNASGAANAFSVAATYVGNSSPNAFSGGSTNPVETFSSDGPRRIFYNANGSAITPGNFLSTGGTLLQKPDITAADGGATATPGFNPFFGTSAAAPHAGAIAALLKSYRPTLTPAQMRSVLTSTALDIEAAGTDRDSGAGIIMANRALQAVNGIHLYYQSNTVDPTGGNGNGVIDPNECNLLNVTLRASFIDPGPFSNVSATLSTSTPGVTIAQGTSSYPNIPSLGTGTNTTPFRITTSSSYVPGTTINFTLAVTYTGGSDSLSFSIATGQVTATFTGSLTAGDPTQTGRLARDNVAALCGSPKTNGLTTATGARAYDAYSFTNGGSATCVTVTLNNPSHSASTSTQIFGAAYLNSFVPANPAANYLSDMGTSNTSTTMSFNVGAGATFVVVVHAIDVGGTIASYNLTVSGLISTATGSGACQVAVAHTPTVSNATTSEDTQTTSGLVVTRNASDGAEVTHFKVTNITNGTLFLNDGTTPVANNSFVAFGASGTTSLKFTPASNLFSPGSSFSFQVQASLSNSDSGLGGSTATATITVSPVADTPSVSNATTSEDTQTTSGLVVTRNSADGSEVGFFKVTSITNGTLFLSDGTTPVANDSFVAFGGTGTTSLKFTPASNLFSPASSFGFTVQASLDNTGTGISAGTAATITVTEVNDAPVAVDDSLSSVAEDSGQRTITFASLLGNDTKGAANESGQTLTITTVSNAVGGAVSISGSNVLFTPTANFNGMASFDYTVQDNGTTNGAADPKTDIGAVSFTVTASNDAPVATDDSLSSVVEDSGQRTIAFTALTGNDNKGAANESGQTLTITAVANAVGGLVSISGSNVLFTPTADFNGTASFDYTVQDNGTTNSLSDPKTDIGAVSFTVTEVNDTPVAVDDALTSVVEDSGQRTIPFATLLGNDSKGPANESGQTLTISTVANAVGGSVTISGSDVLFTPTANFNGTASFDYTVQDNGTTNGTLDARTDVGAVNFTVTASNDAPTATNLTQTKGYTEGAASVALDDIVVSDVDTGDTITARLTLNNPATGSLSTSGTATYTAATGVWTVTGTVAQVNAALAAVAFLPTTDNDVNTTITTRIRDAANSGPADGSITLNVAAVNDAPVAVDDTLSSVVEDSGQRTIPFATLLGNDNKGAANESGQTLTITAVNNAVGGSVSISGSNVLFTPTADFNGTASFDYTVQDNGTTNGAADPKTDIGAVSFTVTEVNDTPVAVDDALTSVVEDSGQRTIPFATLLGNDSKGPANESGQTLTISTVANAVGGSVTISGSDVLFTPTANFNGTASFDYTVQDNGTTNGTLDARTDVGAVSFTVTASNDAPTATNLTQTKGYTEGAASVALDDIVVTDPDTGDTITATLTLNNPATGSLSTSGTATYSAATGVWTISGTVAQVNAALAAVAFVPATNNNVNTTVTTLIRDAANTGPAAGTITIANDDASVSVAVAPATVSEDGAATLVYTFTRSGATTAALTVSFNVTGGATFGTDYTQSGAASFTATTGTVTFATGATTATVTLDPTADPTVEANETAILTLAMGTGYVTSGNPATGTITNDDLPAISINDVAVTEGNSGTTQAVFTVGLSSASAQTVTVSYATTNGTAIAGSDYVAKSGSVTFAPGTTSQTIAVTINGDTQVEGDETYFVNLSNPVNATLPDAQAIGRILNNDAAAPPVNFSLEPANSSRVAGLSNTYISKYSDPNGIPDIAEVRILFNNTLNGANGLQGMFLPATNLLYLRDNVNGAWLGGFPPLSNNVITNSQGSLNCALTTVGGNGNTLSVNWSFTPAATWMGGKYIYMQVRDKGNLVDGWDQMGTVQLVANKAPLNQSVTPSSGSSAAGVARTLTARHYDENGSADIAEARLLVNSTPNGAGALMGMYTPANNKLFLRDNTNGSWLGGFAPGSANVITNSQGSLDCAATSVLFGAQILTINWSFTPTASFVGTKNAYLLVRDRSNAVDGLEPLGTWTITGSAAPIARQTSAVVLSSAEARVSSQSVLLTFSGALDAAVANDAARYAVQVNGQTVPVQSATYHAAGHSVTLSLVATPLKGDDSVVVWWNDLRDSQGASLSGQSAPLRAR